MEAVEQEIDLASDLQFVLVIQRSWVKEGKTYHFGGNQYCNDGLSRAIEFMWSVNSELDQYHPQIASPDETRTGAGLKGQKKQKRVLYRFCQCAVVFSDYVLNAWASRRVKAEGDPESNWNNKETAILCFAVKRGGRLYGGAANGREREIAEIYLRADFSRLTIGSWSAMAKTSTAEIANTAAVMCNDVRLLRATEAAGYGFLDGQARHSFTFVLVSGSLPALVQTSQ
jgi:hypothetical protein